MVGHEVKIETVPPRAARGALQLDETGVNGSSFHAQTGQFRHDERGSRPVQIPPRARQRLAPGPGPGASSVAGQRTSPVGHPRCSVVAVAAACSSSSTSGARLSHLSHVVCVGRSTRCSEVCGSSPNRRFRSRKRRAQGQGLTAERHEPVGVVVGEADRGLTQRVTLPPAIAEQWADQRQPASRPGPR